jgi:glycosyltransferase involved in cell wall biosynthesis
MKIAVIHNFYKSSGGEDRVFENEIAVLRRHGHTVSEFTMHNDEADAVSRLRLAKETIWSKRSYETLLEFFQRNCIDVAHFHNTFPLISPAGYYAARAAGAAVVQTLHNYRLICPSGQLLRAGRVCEDCLGRTFAWPSVAHACYRGERGATAVIAGMSAFHWLRGTWTDQVDRYIAQTEFAKDRFIAGGLPAEKIVVKSHFVSGEPATSVAPRHQRALFVGRLSTEKGIDTLLQAWRGLETPIDVFGSGPLLETVQRANLPVVHVKGNVTQDEVAKAMATACFIVVPSVWYEGTPLVVIEAFAAGLPVIASRLGAMAEIVDDGITGLHFEAGNATDLASKVRWAADHRQDMLHMGDRARHAYQMCYSESIGYAKLISVYEEVLGAAKTKRM